MKSWFFRKNKQPKEAPQEYYEQPRPPVDVSGTYDYDKIAQNQFLSNDVKDGEYFRDGNNYTGRNDATAKEKRMAMDEEAFQRINQDINNSIGNNQQEFSYLNQVSEEISNNHKIPVKKKGLFSRKESITDGYPSYSVQETYHIQDNQAQKYDARVDYNALKNEQTKLLDLSNIDEENECAQQFSEGAAQSFYVDKQKDEQLTNRLFQPENYIMPSYQDNVIVEPASAPTPVAQPQPQPINNAPLSPAAEANTNSPNITSDSTNPTTNIHQPIPTTALRYLTPVEEETTDLRVKKENRRFIKLRG